MDEVLPTYAQVLRPTNLSPSPASTITQSVVQQPQPRNQHDNNPGLDYYEGTGTWGSGANHQQRHQKVKEQEARLYAMDAAKAALDERVEKILEEVQNKECRTKELEDTIANLLTIVSDRDQQLAERDQQFELRNRQFDTLMAILALTAEPQHRPPATDSLTESGQQISPSTPARSNKRQNTLPTRQPIRQIVNANNPCCSKTLLAHAGRHT